MCAFLFHPSFSISWKAHRGKLTHNGCWTCWFSAPSFFFFVGLFCFLFSTSLFSYNTNCTASDLKWNSRCPLISTQRKESLVQRNIYIWIALAFLGTIIGWFYEMHANLLCRPYCPNSQVFLQELMRVPWSSSPTFKMSFNSLGCLAENVLI